MSELTRRNAIIAAAVLPLAGLAVTPAAAQKQPKMQNALDALQQARNYLESAAHNKGGHRKKAIELVNAAIKEVRRGIEVGEA